MLKTTAFVNMLRSLLDSAENSDVICWSENGEYIVIKNEERLIEITSKHCRAKNFSSFRRQLHMYGFRKVNCKSPSPMLIYKHDYFKRDESELMQHLSRRSNGFAPPINTCRVSNQSTQTFVTDAPVCEDPASLQDIKNENYVAQIANLQKHVRLLHQEVSELKRCNRVLSSQFSAQQQLMVAAIQAINNSNHASSNTSKPSPAKSSNSVHHHNLSKNNDIIIIVKNPCATQSSNQNPVINQPQITYNHSDSSITTDNPNAISYGIMDQSEGDNDVAYFTEDCNDVQDNGTVQQQHLDIFSNNYHNNPCFNFPIFIQQSPSANEEQDDCMVTSCNYENTEMQGWWNDNEDTLMLDVD